MNKTVPHVLAALNLSPVPETTRVLDHRRPGCVSQAAASDLVPGSAPTASWPPSRAAHTLPGDITVLISPTGLTMFSYHV